LEGFFEKRRVSSCPATRLPSLEGLDGTDTMVAAVCEASGEAGHWQAVEMPRKTEVGSVDQTFGEAGAAGADPGTQKLLLRLGDVLQVPEPCSAQLPTVGSAGHFSGTCRPCAFVHKRGCDNGVACEFCHLCGPSERKRRQRERGHREKAHRSQQAADDGLVPAAASGFLATLQAALGRF